MNRYKFNQFAQTADESSSHYIMRLKALALDCKYEDMKSDFIRDRLVVGLRSDVQREKLLVKEDLTLESAEAILECAERAKQGLLDLQRPQAFMLCPGTRRKRAVKGRKTGKKKRITAVESPVHRSLAHTSPASQQRDADAVILCTTRAKVAKHKGRGVPSASSLTTMHVVVRKDSTCR